MIGAWRTQCATVELTRRPGRQGRDAVKHLGQLEAGEARRAAMRLERLRRLRVGAQHDVGLDALPPAIVGLADQGYDPARLNRTQQPPAGGAE